MYIVRYIFCKLITAKNPKKSICKRQKKRKKSKIMSSFSFIDNFYANIATKMIALIIAKATTTKLYMYVYIYIYIYIYIRIYTSKDARARSGKKKKKKKRKLRDLEIKLISYI